MPADFTVPDKFNPNRSFTQVIFGDDADLLEVELNELQKIQNYQRSLMARALMSDSFVSKPTMTLMLDILTLPPVTVLANGDFIEILGNMHLPVDTDDVVYLEVSEAVVTSQTALKQSGNLSGVTNITNDLIDYRVGEDTTRRIQKQVRLTKALIYSDRVYLPVATITGSGSFTDNRILLRTLADFTAHLADIAYQTAGGTATALTLAMATLTEGYAKTFIASASNSGVGTTINGKPLYKPGTEIAPTLVEGKAYTIWYSVSDDCFFIKASAEGTATQAQVLADVPFSNENDTGLLGTMPNNSDSGTVYTVSTVDQPVTEGYTDGLASSIKVKGEPNLLESNIKDGVVIGAITGVYNPVSGNVIDTTTPSAPLASQVQEGKVVFVNGASILGTSPSRVGSATVITPSAVDQVIPAGIYGGDTGDGKVLAVVVPPTKVLDGTTIASVAGSMVDHTGANSEAVDILGTVAGSLHAKPSEGYWSGAESVIITEANLNTNNIKAGSSIFGIPGKASVVDTADATAIANKIMAGLYAYINGVKTLGTMVDRGSPIWTPTTSNQALGAGYYGGGTVLGDTQLKTENIRAGKTIFGVAGSVIDGAGLLKYKKGSIAVGYTGGGTPGAINFHVTGLNFTPVLCLVNFTGAPATYLYGECAPWHAFTTKDAITHQEGRSLSVVSDGDTIGISISLNNVVHGSCTITVNLESSSNIYGYAFLRGELQYELMGQ